MIQEIARAWYVFDLWVQGPGCKGYDARLSKYLPEYGS